MNLDQAKQLALSLMAKHGLTCPFRFDRGKNRHGCCHWERVEFSPARQVWYRGRLRYIADMVVGYISLSAYYVQLNSQEQVEQTILHEIAHALCGPLHHHDHIWLIKAREIGYKGGRCAEAETLEGNYQAKCECGQVYHRYRMPKVYTATCSCGLPHRLKKVSKTRSYRCVRCRETLIFTVSDEQVNYRCGVCRRPIVFNEMGSITKTKKGISLASFGN